ncbi:MAG: GNAT family N-acetyltransferase [Chloroflexi bacterium]|nr:GNAT family N-acetyltransferase [Chloroflexota bacterium]
MDFAPAPFAEIQEATRRHLRALPSAIDSFLEDHILASTHYRIVVGSETAGFASVHDERLITQFALDQPYRYYGQPIFQQVRQLEQVRSAFVPTCDELFLSHALDDYRQLAKQAYFFTAVRDAPGSTSGRYTMRPADVGDVELVREESGDFFQPLEQHITAGEVFVTLRGEEPVGFGILIKSLLYDDVASIGMYTIERFRRAGVGAATIRMLMDECRRRSLRPVAGCSYYNHRSKQTLERAGMFSPTRLLKIDY